MSWIQKEGYKTKKLASGRSSRTNEFEISEVHFKKGKYKHFHKKKTEHFYILGGKGKIDIDGNIRTLRKGDFVIIRPNEVHTWINESFRALKAINIKIDNITFRVNSY